MGVPLEQARLNSPSLPPGKDRISTDSIVMEPNVPAGPCAPVSPLGPCWPVAPAGPAGPRAPGGPAGPDGPAWFQWTLNWPRGQVTGWVEVFHSERHGNLLWAPCVTTQA